MYMQNDHDLNPYLLLTPGPLSTTGSVKEAMLKDWCTWDAEYNELVQTIRSKLVQLATNKPDCYTTVLMQGSGTFSVESVIGTVIPPEGKLLVLTNGAYGKRMVEIAGRIAINTVEISCGEVGFPDLKNLEETLQFDKDITHVAVVHCETTTGMLNPIREIGEIVTRYEKTYIVDAMSSFGGIPMDVDELSIDYLVSSANKCIQGVPGFGIIVAKKDELASCKNQARSLSLDLYDQWETMEQKHGKWRYTSPTHTVHAFYRALQELEEEGGAAQRFERYQTNQRTLVEEMRKLGFQTLLPDDQQSPVITSFHYPDLQLFDFQSFYRRLKEEGFVIYPGKVTDHETFRVGNIGTITPDDMKAFAEAVKKHQYWMTEMVR